MKKWLIVIAAVCVALPLWATECLLISGDNTDQVQKCLDDAAKGDHVVNIAPFLISAPVTIPERTALRGSGASWGTVVTVNFGRGESSENKLRAGLIMKNGSTIDGITPFYPGQLVGKALVEYPPTIAVISGDTTVENCTFPNSYVAVDVRGAHGRFFVRNNRYGPHFRMIRIDECYDVDDLSNNRSNPAIWAGNDNSELYAWMHNNSVGIEANRLDWLWIDRFFDWGVKYGIWLNQSVNGISHGVQVVQSGCDACRYGIYSNIESGDRPWLVTVSNWSGTSFNPVDDKDDGVSIYLAHIEGVNISNSNFWGLRNEGIYLNDCSTVSLLGINFLTDDWNIAENNSAAIHLVNCRRGSIVGNSGASSRDSSVGIILEGSHNIKVIANPFETKGPAIKILSSSSGITALANGGCVQDLTNDPTNKIDTPCYMQPQNTATPIPTPKIDTLRYVQPQSMVTPIPMPMTIRTKPPDKGQESHLLTSILRALSAKTS